MSYLHRKYNLEGDTPSQQEERRSSDSTSREMTEFSDYTKESLELFRQKLSTYIEVVDRNLASAAEDSVHFDYNEKSPLDSCRK
ncbi:unnamed protein product [Heterobilharzia americana]|nr:unnamed protein product [Heterobilharzia americana]